MTAQILGVTDMRRALAENPQWNIIEAFTALFGVPPTGLQESNHDHPNWASLGDPESIQMLPEQYYARLKRLWEFYPAISFSPQMIAPSISLKKFKPVQVELPDWFTGWIDDCFPSRDAMKAADAMVFAEISPLWTLYREILQREPDPEGFAFWNGVYEQEGWTWEQIETALWNSDEISRQGAT